MGPTFGELARRWWEGVERGSIGKRKGGGGAGYSETTLKGYERTLRKRLLPEFGGRYAAEITEVDWQLWVDRLSQEGLSRSRIANQRSVVSAIYGWASRPTRRLVPSNPMRGIELPPNDEKPRTRVAPLEEAEQLLARAQARLPDSVRARLLCRPAARGDLPARDGRTSQLDGYRLDVRKSKSAAGTNRRPPIAEPLREILRAAALRNPSEPDDPVSRVRHVRQARRLTRRRRGERPGSSDHAARVPPHLRLVPDGGRLHAQGTHGVHGPRRPADGQPLHEAPAAAGGGTTRPSASNDYLARQAAPATRGSGRE